jgi:hypothetical protein
LADRSVSVKLTADVSGFVSAMAAAQASVAALQRQLRDPATIKVDADTAAAESQMRAMHTEVGRLDGQTARVDVDADTASATTNLRSVESDVNRLSGHSARVNVDADVGGALSAIAMVGAALASLPAVTSIAVGVSVLGAAFTAAGAGAAGFAAVAVPSLGRINEALKQQASAAGGAGGATKSAGQSAAEAASRALQLEQAERRVADAQKGVKQAQEDLTRARRDAKRALDDLTLSVKDAALAEQDAALSVEEARQRLAEVRADPDSDELDVKRAELNYRMSVQRLEEQSVRTKRLKEDQKEAAKAGVEGSDQVRAAQDKLLKAETDLAMASKQLTVLKLQQKAAMEAAGGAAGGAASKMAELSKAERELAKDVKKFQDGYIAWQRSLQPDVFPAIRSGMDLMSTGMKTSTPLVKASAAAFDDFLKQANKELKSEQWQSFFRDLTEQAPRAIDGLGDSALNVAGGLTGIVQAFLPFTDELMDNLEDITQEFENWGQGLEKSPEFEAFMKYVAEQGPKVAEILGNVATFVGKVMQAGGNAAPAVLDFLVVLSDRLAGMDPGQIQAIATGVGLIFAAVRLGTTLKLGVLVLLADVLSQMSPGEIQALAVAITGVIVAVKGYQAVSGAVGFFSSLSSSLDKAGKSADGASGKLGAVTGLLKGGVAVAAVAGYAAAFDAVGDSLTGLNPDLEELSKNLVAFGKDGTATADVLDQLGPKTTGVWGAFENFGQSAARLADSGVLSEIAKGTANMIDSTLGIQLDSGKQAVDNLDASLALLVSNGNSEQAAVTFKRLADQAVAAGTPVEKLKELFPQYAASMDGIPTTTGAVGTAVELLGGQVNGAQREIGAAAERLGVFKTSLDAFNSQTDAAATVRDMEKAFNDAKTAIEGANGKLTLTPGLTAAQRDAVIQAREAFAGYVETVRLSAEAQVTLTGRTTEARDAVLRQLPAMIDLAGKNEAARTQVLELAKAYGISESDAIKAAKGGQNLVEVLAKLKSKDIRVGADMKPAQEAIDNFITLNSGRKIPLHVYTKNSQLAAGAIMRYAEGGVQKFASGGRATPAPHIADSPTILYGEGNGPEAFIPYDPAFRDRAMDLVSQVASDFGGKFVTGSSAGAMGTPANSSKVSAPQQMSPSRQYAPASSGGSSSGGDSWDGGLGSSGGGPVVAMYGTVIRESMDADVVTAKIGMAVDSRG